MQTAANHEASKDEKKPRNKGEACKERSSAKQAHKLWFDQAFAR